MKSFYSILSTLSIISVDVTVELVCPSVVNITVAFCLRPLLRGINCRTIWSGIFTLQVGHVELVHTQSEMHDLQNT